MAILSHLSGIIERFVQPFLSLIMNLGGMISIRFKIVSFFIILGGICGYTTFLSLHTSDLSLEKLQITYDKPLMASNFARNILINFQKAQLEYATGHDETIINDYLSSALDDIEVVRERFLAPNTAKYLSKIANLLEEWKSLSEQNANDDTLTQKANIITEQIDILIEEEFSAGYDFIIEGKKTVLDVKNQTQYIGTMGASLLILGAIYILCAISLPIKRCLYYANLIAQGDLNNNIIPSGSFEFRKLFKSLSNMQTDLVQIINKRQQEVLEFEKHKQIDEIKKIMQHNSEKREEIIREQNVADTLERRLMLEHLAHELNDNITNVIEKIGVTDDNLKNISQKINMAVVQTVDGVRSGSQNANSQLNHIMDSFSGTAEILKNSMSHISHDVIQVAQSVDTMSNISNRVKSQSDIFMQATRDISKVVSVIQSIADHINILSVNATIEAARAGEHGKGFAVVASEIKNLAVNTTKESNQIIAQIQRLNETSYEMQSILPEINKSVDNVHILFTKVRHNMDTQNEDVAVMTETTTQKIYDTVQLLQTLFRKIEDMGENLYTHIRSVDDISKTLSDNTRTLNTAINGFTQNLVEPVQVLNQVNHV